MRRFHWLSIHTESRIMETPKNAWTKLKNLSRNANDMWPNFRRICGETETLTPNFQLQQRDEEGLKRAHRDRDSKRQRELERFLLMTVKDRNFSENCCSPFWLFAKKLFVLMRRLEFLIFSNIVLLDAGIWITIIIIIIINL